jgi:hypothetical protein
MSRILGVLAASLLYIVVAGAQPKINIVEPNFDFGFAPEGATMIHEYVVKNIGTEPLEISRVRTTCGCASAPVKKSLLQPKEETVITLIFNSTRYFHKTSKQAMISSNDPNVPSEIITFVADMDSVKSRSITALPRKVDVGSDAGFKRANVVKIKNLTNDIVTLKIVDFYNEVLDTPTLSATEIAANGSIDMSVSVLATIPADNLIQGSVTLSANDKTGKEMSRLTIPVYGGGKGK